MTNLRYQVNSLQIACWVIFHCFCCRLLTLFKVNFFKTFFQEHYQSVKGFGSRAGLTFCPNCLKRLSTEDKSPLARKDLRCPNIEDKWAATRENLSFVFQTKQGSNLFAKLHRPARLKKFSIKQV